MSFFVKQSDETKKEMNYRSTNALSNILTSMKRTRSDNIFMFREFEKSLKGTLGGLLFRIIYTSLKK